MSTFHRKRHDSGTATPIPPIDISPIVLEEQLDGADQDEWSKLKPFLSAPTTPRSGKKKCHFADTPPEDIDFTPRRTNTAPANLSDLSLPDARRDQVSLLDAQAEAEAASEDYRVLLGEPESTSGEQQSDNGEPQEGYSNFYDIEVEEVNDPHQSSSEEELPHVSPDTGTPFGMEEIRTQYPFRLGKPRSNTFGSIVPQDFGVATKSQRSSSLSALYSRPTGGPLIKTSAAPTTSHIDAHVWNNGRQTADLKDDSPSMSRSNTMIDSSDDILPTMWEEGIPYTEREKSSSSASSKESPDRYTSGSEFPLETIRTQLSMLSRANGQDDTVKKHRSDLEIDPDEIPATPPNTRKPSHSARHGNPKSIRRHFKRSAGSSPPLMSPTIESPASSVHDSPPLKTSLKQGGLSRQFGALSASDRFAYTHRDSLELAHHRLANKSPVLDPLLSSARDSMILAKQRFDKYPKSRVIIDEKTGQVKFGGLSPIMDASPPDVRAHFAIRRKQEEKEQREQRWKKEIGGHPENDDECPICEVERPRARRMTLGS